MEAEKYVEGVIIIFSAWREIFTLKYEKFHTRLRPDTFTLNFNLTSLCHESLLIYVYTSIPPPPCYAIADYAFLSSVSLLRLSSFFHL